MGMFGNKEVAYEDMNEEQKVQYRKEMSEHLKAFGIDGIDGVYGVDSETVFKLISRDIYLGKTRLLAGEISLSYLETLIRQNWIMISQSNKLNKTLEEIKNKL